MSQRGRHGVGSVLTLDRGRIGDLRIVAPPEADRELLRLPLHVIAHEQLGTVADVVVDPGNPLSIILVEDLRLNVVVTLSLIRVCVWGGKQLHQVEHVLIEVCCWDGAVESTIAIGGESEQLPGRII